MRYIISDIHGCYHEYMELLNKIKFSDKDELYILGDAVDRGPEPIKVLKDIMNRRNAVFIIGNHDFIMYTLMRELAVEITAENVDNYFVADDILDYNLWMQDGGQVTAEQFRALSKEEKAEELSVQC